MGGTITWISGATGGLGLGLARNVPYAGARVINISRRPHPDYETVVADLATPEGWAAARESFERELTGFSGERAVFIHNAYYAEATGLISKIDAATYDTAVMVNAAAPLVLGAAFLRASDGLAGDVGLALMSSGAVDMPIDGVAAYGAGKSAVEYWVQAARHELGLAGDRRWVVAVRPGGVDTPGSRRNAALPKETWPFVEVRREMHKDFSDIDIAARRIWSALPPAPETYLISLSPPPATDAAARFGAQVDYVA